MTQLHAGGKFENTSDDNAYKVSGGLHGVGVSVVNALQRMARPDHLARRRRALHALPPRRCRGAAEGRRQAPRQEGHAGSPSCPRPTTFKIIEFDFDRLEHRFRELAFLNSGVRLVLADARHEERRRSSFITRAASRPSSNISTAPRRRSIPDPISVTGQRDDIGIDVALEWNDSYYEKVLCFTNNIPQRDGGTHLAAFRAALTRTLNNYADKSGMLKREKVSLTGEDMREGLTAIVSVKLPDPKFSSPDQGQAGQLRGAPAARKPDGRQDGRMARGKSGPRPHDHPEDHRRRRRARGRPQGARGQPQVGDGHRLAARQARRLPGARSGQVRAVPGRGRQRRRLGQAGPRPQVPGDPAARRARSSTSSARASTGCCRPRRSAR